MPLGRVRGRGWEGCYLNSTRTQREMQTLPKIQMKIFVLKIELMMLQAVLYASIEYILR